MAPSSARREPAWLATIEALRLGTGGPHSTRVRLRGRLPATIRPMPRPHEPAAPRVVGTPVERHGPSARTALIFVGFLFVIPFGALGSFMALDASRTATFRNAAEEIAIAAFMLAIAAYGAALAWRGLRGYSRPTARSRRMLVAAACVFIGGGLAEALYAFVRAFTVGPVILQRAPWYSFDGSAWYAVLASVAVPLQLAAHELGHVVAGHLVGFEFHSIQVGPFCLDRLSGPWRMTWQPLALGLGGRATVVTRGGGRLPHRKAAFAAGGPAGNLLLTLAAVLAAAVAPTPTTAAGAFAGGFLHACVVLGIVFCLVNLVPVRGAGTDGARIVEALGAVRNAVVESDGVVRVQGARPPRSQR